MNSHEIAQCNAEEKFFFNDMTLSIKGNLNIYDYRMLKNILAKERIVKIIVEDNIKIDVCIMHLLGKAALKKIEITGIDTSTELWKKLQSISHKKSALISDINFNIFYEIANVLQSFFFETNDGQRQLGQYFFFKFLYSCTIQILPIVFIFLFNIGFTATLIIYKKLAIYNVSYDSPELVYHASVALMAPYLSIALLIMQSATSICSLLKIKKLNEEPFILSIFALSMEQTYFHSIIYAFALGSVFIHLVGLFATFLGSACAWFVQTDVDIWSSFIDNFVRIEKYSSDVIVSIFKSFLSGIWVGCCVCACGTYPGNQAQVIIEAINQCVFYSIAGMSIIHLVVSIFDRVFLS